MAYYRIIIAALLLSSCRTPQQKLTRLLTEHPQLQDEFVVTVLDTAWSIRYLHDTTFTQVRQIDTLVTDNDTVNVTIYRYLDRVRVITKLKPLPIVQRDTVRIMQVKKVDESKAGPYFYSLWIIVGMMAVILLIKK